MILVSAVRANFGRPSDTMVAARPEDAGPGGLTLMSVNPLGHEAAIKQLFVEHERPEFPAFFDRAYPDVVAEGGMSWVGWDKRGRLAAHIAHFPREFVVNGRRVRGALLANLMVATAHRSFWPALALARRVVNDLTRSGSADFIYSDPNDRARPVLLGAGFQEIGALRRCVLPLSDRRKGIALGLRLYNLFQRLRTRPLVGTDRLTDEPDDVADSILDGGPRDLRPIRRASLYRARLAGYPSAHDRWFTFHRRGGETSPVGKALVRGPDRDGVAVVCMVQCAALAHLSPTFVTLGEYLARAGAMRLEIWIMDRSQVAAAARRAGFLVRPESVPVLAQALTPLGAEAMDSDWQILALDLDR